MAANMIGVNKRIIVFDNEGNIWLQFNPVIVKKSGAYEATEGRFLCRHAWKTMRCFKPSRCSGRMRDSKRGLKTFTEWTAEIIQHDRPLRRHFDMTRAKDAASLRNR